MEGRKGNKITAAEAAHSDVNEISKTEIMTPFSVEINLEIIQADEKTIRNLSNKMAMRLLFASFDYLRAKDANVSLASSSILANLKNSFGLTQKAQTYFSPQLEVHHRQYDVRKADARNVTSKFLHDFDNIKPEILATGIYVWNESFVQNVMMSLGHKRLTTIVGGPQITYSPKGSLEESYPFADIFIRGYAEQSFEKVLKVLLLQRSLEGHSIQGVHIKGEVDLNGRSLYNLDSLPSPLLNGVVDVSKGYTRLETKRGCPFTCSFCQHKDSYEKRLNCSPERISNEINWITTQKINDISIVDPIFNSGGNHYLNILDGFIRNKYDGRLSLQSRFEMVNDEYLDRCSQLLEGGANIELEFGIQTISSEESKVIRRKNNLRRLLIVAEKLRERQIPFEVSLIYGLPLQTVDSFSRGIDWVQNFIKPNIIHAWPLMLLKGTELFHLKNKFNLEEQILDEFLEPVDGNRIYQGIPHVIKSSSFTEADWQKMRAVAQNL